MSILLDLIKGIFLGKKNVHIAEQESALDSTKQHLFEIISMQLISGDIVAAETSFINAMALFPESQEILGLRTEIEFIKCLEAVEKRFPGPQYLEWLAWFHTRLKPANYMEIGVESGQSLQFARSPTHSVGVDPAIQIVHPQENWCKLFKQTSDDFFATHTTQEVFGSNKINLAFIDGLHTFDQALKDFINIERSSDTSSVVLFHDIFPVVPATAQRNRSTKFWTGDTWKVMLILIKHRPDLKIFTIPTRPSGLGVVTGLNPKSTILQSDFDQICSHALELDLEQYLSGIDDHLHAVENNFDTVSHLLTRDVPSIALHKP